jgi:hypothetical protein
MSEDQSRKKRSRVQIPVSTEKSSEYIKPVQQESIVPFPVESQNENEKRRLKLLKKASKRLTQRIWIVLSDKKEVSCSK